MDDGRDEEGRVRLDADAAAVCGVIVNAGLKVHRTFGPGLLESAYEQCLVIETKLRGLDCRQQVLLPLVYEGVQVEASYRLDMLIAERVVVEVKAAEKITSLHKAQLLTYLRLSRYRVGFLFNFNVRMFREGIRRLVLRLGRRVFLPGLPVLPVLPGLPVPPCCLTCPDTDPKGHRRRFKAGGTWAGGAG